MKHLEVVAAILIYDGKILCMERGKGKYDYVSFKYEFPGGKIEPGEAKHAALERELREEMKLNVSVAETDLFTTVEHTYPDFSITMYAFICHLKNPEFVRKEHVDHKWLAPEELPSLDWAAADVPIMEKLAGK
jgi:8-oxo-dGTP diphosphatase